MFKRILPLLVIVALFLFFLTSPGDVFGCTINSTTGQQVGCNEAIGEVCVPFPNDPTQGDCKLLPIPSIFGKIQPPDPLKKLLGTDPTGAGAISQFLSNLVVLIFSIASIALIFMLLWGAFEWLTSGGDKEKLSSAQKRIINAIIGIILFAIAFAVIGVLGQFTGFTFFKR